MLIVKLNRMQHLSKPDMKKLLLQKNYHNKDNMKKKRREKIKNTKNI